MKKELRYLPEYNNFGIEKIELAYAEAHVVTLSPECYKRLGLPLPKRGAPKVAFLMGQDGIFHTVDLAYAYSVAKTGAELIGLDYAHYKEQMKGCHGLILPGGAFASPVQYYLKDDPAAANEKKTSFRAEAYRGCFHQAAFMGIPILGICAGMQMLAGELGCRMCSNAQEYFGGSIIHKTIVMQAHEVIVIPGTLLYELVKTEKLPVNTRHTEGICQTNNLVTVNALAPDGCPEALEVTEDGAEILGVQWHPEDYVIKGDDRHFAIYQWLADRAKAYKQNKKTGTS